jgi:hypothetical protein
MNQTLLMLLSPFAVSLTNDLSAGLTRPLKPDEARAPTLGPGFMKHFYRCNER